MNKFAKKWINSVLLFIGILFLLGGCSTKMGQNNIDKNSEITASIIEDTRENCRLSNESDCRPIEITKGEPEDEELVDNFTDVISIKNDSENKIIMQNSLNLTTVCEAGWKCIKGKYTAYQETNCSWHSLERCIYGCDENEMSCRTAPVCKVNSLRCENDNLMICGEDGYGWILNKSCDKDCENNACTEDLGINATLNITINTTTNDYIKDECIKVINFNYNASGPDNSSNLNDEYFTLKNICAYSIDVTNWTAKDASNHDFRFSTFNLGINADITMHTGSGTDDSINLYWNMSIHIWNNLGDTLYLNTANGTSVLIYSYP